jgi:multiple sugar transport system permease protein
VSASRAEEVETTPAEPSARISGSRRRLRRSGASRDRKKTTLKAKFFSYLVLLPIMVLFVAPFVWLISASFQPVSTIFQNPPSWIPGEPTLNGYKGFLNVGELSKAERGRGSGDWKWFVNSAFVAVTVVTVQTFFNALCAYCFAKRKFPGRNVIFMIFLATMMVPGMVLLIPNYIILQHIPFMGGNDWLGNGGEGLLNNYAGLILPQVVTAFGIFLLRQYMLSIPDDLLEAARIDGAGEFRIFWSVVLPLCTPALAANAIFSFQSVWEDFFWPLIVMTDPEKYTVPVGLALFVVQNRTSWTLLFAGSVIATLPMLIVFLVLQRYFVQGIALTGVKG